MPEGEKIPLVAGRECGPCSLCCKVLSILYFDPPKPAGKWCQHCKPGQGCAVWQDRPKGCDDFNCDWRKNPLLGDEWRPDRAGFLINQVLIGAPFEIIVDVGRPDAWRKEPYYSRLKEACARALEANQLVSVTVGSRKWVMLPHDDVPVPSDCIGGDMHVSREADVLGGRWKVVFSRPGGR